MGECVISNILEILSCVLYAAAATIFFKKTFRQNVISTVVCLVLTGTFLKYFDSCPQGLSMAMLIPFGVLIYDCRQNVDWWKTALKLDMFVVFLLALLDVQFKLHAFVLAKINVELWILFRILCASVPQFLRKPVWLKAKLQGARSKLGPMYVLFVSCYVLTLDRSLFHTLLGTFAAVVGIFAGVFCRPDNSTMLEVFGYSTRYQTRRKYHGRLMVASFLSCLLLFLEHYGCVKFLSNHQVQNPGFLFDSSTTQIL